MMGTELCDANSLARPGQRWSNCLPRSLSALFQSWPIFAGGKSLSWVHPLSRETCSACPSLILINDPLTSAVIDFRNCLRKRGEQSTTFLRDRILKAQGNSGQSKFQRRNIAPSA